MSRVVLVALDRKAVEAQCEAADVGISALEELGSGGMRLVCMSREGAETMEAKFKKHLIKGEVTRMRIRPRFGPR